MSHTLSDYDYDLPEHLIAQEPARPRDHARLLVYDRASRTITDDRFYRIGRYLADATTLVANNSRVERCRLLFEDGKREVFILRRHGDGRVEALVRPGKFFKKGRTVTLADGIGAEVLDVDEEGIRTLRLQPDLRDPVYESFRHTPFPPYIEQNEELSQEYQTVYARLHPEGGSKAAPTAGLHFTPALIDRLRGKGLGWLEVTLHVGLGTFAPVKHENIDEHPMHSERYELDAETAGRLNATEHITAVGTTSVRVLESICETPRRFRPGKGETDIFIRPGYAFRAVDSLITNFHLPKSTLLMLVAAMTGFEEMHRIYAHAREQEYRFYSFGDAMLIL